MSLTASIIRRLLIMIPMLIGVTMLAFIVSHLVPSDPLVLLVSEKAMNNPEIVKAAVEKWGSGPIAARAVLLLSRKPAAGKSGCFV